MGKSRESDFPLCEAAGLRVSIESERTGADKISVYATVGAHAVEKYLRGLVEDVEAKPGHWARDCHGESHVIEHSVYMDALHREQTVRRQLMDYRAGASAEAVQADDGRTNVAALKKQNAYLRKLLSEPGEGNRYRLMLLNHDSLEKQLGKALNIITSTLVPGVALQYMRDIEDAGKLEK